MMRSCVFALFALVCAGGTEASTYRCDAVDDLARLGYDGSAKVAVVGRNKECKFSIGGASADGAEPSTDFQQERMDSKLVTDAPKDFISKRLASVIVESALRLGDSAAFVLKDIKADTDPSKLSCLGRDPLKLDHSRITCIVLGDANQKAPQGFENGIVSAVLFKRTVIFEIRDLGSGSSVMVIFISMR
jgi:hypothetical protein